MKTRLLFCILTFLSVQGVIIGYSSGWWIRAGACFLMLCWSFWGLVLREYDDGHHPYRGRWI